MSRLHIYGGEAKCKATLARYLERGRQLLDEAVGVRKRVVGLAGTDFARDAATIETDWAREFREWLHDTREAMSDYLGDQLADVLPVIEFGVPLATGKPGYVIGLDNGEPWLRDALDELRELQRVLR
jgi:hypothetical protein